MYKNVFTVLNTRSKIITRKIVFQSDSVKRNKKKGKIGPKRPLI